MPKLNQIIAVANGKKSQTQSELTRIHHALQKSALLEGINRTYRPKDEEGEKLPAEKKEVQFTSTEAIRDAARAVAELFDVVATQDAANCQAKADVVVDGQPILREVPVTHLLFLEKQLVDLHTFVDKLPTLDPAERWTYDPNSGVYRSETFETTRTKKVPKNHIKYEATKEHPAQVEVFFEDVIVGTWSTTKFSGSVPADERRGMLERVRKLQEAVKFAREEANGLETVEKKTGQPVLEYIFGKSAI